MNPRSQCGFHRTLPALATFAAFMCFVAPVGADESSDRKPLQLEEGFSQVDLRVGPSLTSYHGRNTITRTLRDENPRLAALESFFGDSSREWEVLWDSRGDRPHLIHGAGYPLLPGAGNGLSHADAGLMPDRKARLTDVERLVRGFLARYPDLLRVDPRSLRLDQTRSTSFDDGRAWVIELQQYYRGVPVEGANVFFRINNGNIVQFGADRIGDVRVRMVSGSQRARAFATLLKRLRIRREMLSEILDAGTLKIYPTLTAGEKAGNVYRGRRGTGYSYRLVWEFSFRVRDDVSTYKTILDAHSGELLQVLDLNRYAQVKGGVYLTTNADPEAVVPFPYANVTNGTVKVTDAEGNYTYGGGTATATLNGQYVRINDSCGPISLSGDSDGNIDLGKSGGSDCITPGFGGAGNTHASRTAFYHLTKINRKAAGYLPDNPWLNGKVTANVNLTTTACNAFWDTTKVNFFRSGTDKGNACSNTGELAAILFHEWGHGMEDNSGGGADDGSDEAAADTFAFLETKDSCIGRNVKPGVDCHNCTNCTGFRDVAEFASGSKRIAKPSTIEDDTGIDCDLEGCPYEKGRDGTGPQGPMGYEAHCESYIASSANWDLAQLLMDKYGPENGWATMESIWYKSLTARKSAYRLVSGGQCNPSATVDGCEATNWYTVYLAADDDDGDLNNGTPNGCRIWDAFNAHGIACGDRPACSGGSLHVVSPNGGERWTRGADATLSWTSSGLAESTPIKFDLFRGAIGDYSHFIGIMAQDIPAGSGLQSYTWNGRLTDGRVPDAADDYWVGVQTMGLGNNDVWDDADGHFTISDPLGTITVLSPNGGENWTRGAPATVSWTSSGLAPNTPIKFDLFRGPIGDWSHFIGIMAEGVAVGAGSQSYAWNGRLTDGRVPDAADDYWIGIQTMDVGGNDIGDLSDEHFAIADVLTTIPAGAIVPFDSDAAIPSGWTLFTPANGRYVVGAGRVHAVGATGGDGTLTVNTTVNGEHTGNDNWSGMGSSGQWGVRIEGGPAGNHAHQIGFISSLGSRQMRFMKASTQNDTFPASALVLATQNLDGLTNVHAGDNRYLVPANARTTTVSAIAGASCSTAGAHQHAWVGGNWPDWSWSEYPCYDEGAEGDHTHTVSLSLASENVKKAYVTAWTDASAAFGLTPGMIAMYESLTPPPGWVLCDGNNGTVDLRDYFVFLGPEASQGTKTGDNTLTVSDSIESVSWTHDHISWCSWASPTSWSAFQHSSGSFPHSHDLITHNPVYQPPYYALVFIQKQ